MFGFPRNIRCQGAYVRLLTICSKQAKGKCTVKHVNSYIKCVKHVVYAIPLSCGNEYVGQTKRCVNVRLREHELSLQGVEPRHLPVHCNSCGCRPLFDKTSIIFKHTNQLTREIAEAYNITIRGKECISEPSIALHDKEFHYFCNF